MHLAVVVERIQRTTYPIEIKERKQTKSNHPVQRALLLLKDAKA